METIYLLEKTTNKMLQEFHDVISWSENFVLFQNGKFPSKVYAQENEYFSAELPEIKDIEDDLTSYSAE